MSNEAKRMAVRAYWDFTLRAALAIPGRVAEPAHHPGMEAPSSPQKKAPGYTNVM